MINVSHLRRLLRDTSGATAIEYALIAGLIAIAIVASLMAVGDSLSGSLFNVASSFS